MTGSDLIVYSDGYEQGVYDRTWTHCVDQRHVNDYSSEHDHCTWLEGYMAGYDGLPRATA